MLLKNYYTCLTGAAIGTYNVTEDVSSDLSPRYSRLRSGAYQIITGNLLYSAISSNAVTSRKFFYGAYNSFTNSDRACSVIGFGNNTEDVTFNDYTPTGDVSVSLVSTFKSASTTYDNNTKTYTHTSLYTLTNNSNYALPINEIMLGFYTDVSDYLVYFTRDLLGNNSFTIESKESVNFELSIKYTIAEPLQ